MDKISAERRSKNMRRIKSKNTKQELAVRKLLTSLGYRFRIHAKELPGKPDLVFPGRKQVIFVHGCFWHMHDDPNCRYVHIPKSKQAYWLPKLERNKQRDSENQRKLEELGWDSLVIWECQIPEMEKLINLITDFLE